jgi:sugar/nucleoside kinase (ribokinase family)
MKIAVVGTVMRDEIHPVGGERRESFGGILYNVLALAALAAPGDTIHPVCHLAADHKAAIAAEFFAGFPAISDANMHACPGGTDENVLRYRTKSEREERMTLRTPPVSPGDLAPVLDADAILLNFISGREIDLATLRALRARTRAHLHLDIHNLGKRLDEQSRLRPAGLPDWREWLAAVDTLQANEWEIELLLGSKPATEAEVRRAALALLDAAPLRAVALTIGGDGCALAHRTAPDGAPRYLRIPAMDFGEVVDTTGCGDSFSSAFVVTMLREGNPALAAVHATALSGLNTLGAGLQAIALEGSLDDTVRAHFPDIWSRVRADGWIGDPA